MKKEHVKLNSEERTELAELVNVGHTSGRRYRRALALLELDRGKTFNEVSKTVNMNSNTLSTLSKKYREEGLSCLNDKPRSGRPVEIGGGVRAKVTALACSTPPEGYGRWSLRLLAERIVQLEYVDDISHTEVGRILKKTNSSLT